MSTWYSNGLEHITVILCSQMKSPSMTTVVNGNNKTLYMPNIPSIEQATKKNLKEKLTGMYVMIFTVYVVYLVVALIWHFGKSCLYRQIKCMRFRL